MSKIDILGDTQFPKEKITKQVESVIKDRIFTIKKKIKATNQQLSYLRDKYNMSDKEFLREYNNGELGDDEDYFHWKGSIQVLDALDEELALLQDAI